VRHAPRYLTRLHPLRHGQALSNLESKHGADERVLVEDLLFQTQAAIFIARTIGSLD
jgi:hypothetical protein